MALSRLLLKSERDAVSIDGTADFSGNQVARALHWPPGRLAKRPQWTTTRLGDQSDDFEKEV
jgi:hypothetical protein